ncbi:MAG: hypothetical protein IJ242_08905 [Clostridia bacterium]|nr:hypothetical protein [Clostridia bacterium]MBQ9256660.1 hypothetical protein [Acidaminococcaceae bacterium]
MADSNSPKPHSIAQAKYDKANTVRYGLKLNTTTDADVIEWLAKQDSMQGAIKRLIRNAIDQEK